MTEEMELADVTIPDTAIPQQFEHSTNQEIHRYTTVQKSGSIPAAPAIPSFTDPHLSTASFKDMA